MKLSQIPKRLLSLLLALCLVLGYIPVPGYAAENDGLCELDHDHATDCSDMETVEEAEELDEIQYSEEAKVVNATNPTLTITTAEQLADLAVKVNHGTYGVCNVTLGADISLHSYSNWTPIGTAENPFRGKFDGNGHTVSNLKINANDLIYAGLFGNISNGGVRDLTVTGSVTVTQTKASAGGSSYVGMIVGHMEDGILYRCNAEGSVNVNGYSGDTLGDANWPTVGGLAGTVNHGVVLNCGSSASVTTDLAVYVGGLIGLLSAGYDVPMCLLNSYSCGVIACTNGNSTGGLVGYLQDDAVNNYFSGEITTDSSGSVGAVFGYVGNSIIDASGSSVTFEPLILYNYYPVMLEALEGLSGVGMTSSGLTLEEDAARVFLDSADAMYKVRDKKDFVNEIIEGHYGYLSGSEWAELAELFDGAELTAGCWRDINQPLGTCAYVDGECMRCAIYRGLKGEGTAESPYLITKAVDLKYFAGLVNAGMRSIHGKLTEDIEMDGVEWTPICSTGLYYKTTSYPDKGYEGTFDGNGFVIYNLTVYGEPGAEASYGLFGTLSGTVKNLGIEDMTFELNDAEDVRAAGIVGQMLDGSLVENCYVANSTLAPKNYIVGGIAGCNYAGTIQNCHTYNVTVDANSRCGNLVSDTRGDISSSDRPGAVINCYTNAERLVGTQTGNRVTDSEAGISDARFISGEIAYRLQGQQPYQIWGQSTWNQKYPIVGGSKVYYGYLSCTAEEPCYTNYQWARPEKNTHEYYAETRCAECGYYCQHPGFTDGKCIECGNYGFCGAEGDGTNLTWFLEFELVIYGQGAMKDYSGTDMPWYDRRNLFEEVFVREGVTSIGDYALASSNALTRVVIPDSVTRIGEGAFEKCESLEQITLPAQVTEIPKQAFSQCSSLNTVTFEGEISSIGEAAFYDCTDLTSTSFSDGLKTIGDLAFHQCTGLTEINIPNSVTSIGAEAFDLCTNVKSVTIGKGVTEIGKQAFSDCTALETLTWLAEGDVTLGEKAFTDTENIDLILARGCADQVTDSVVWNGCTFKSIQVFCKDGTLNHAFGSCSDKGDGTHAATCSACGYVRQEAHAFGGGSTCDVCGIVCFHTTFVDGTCLCGQIVGGYCGAEEGGKNLTWTLADGVLTIKGEGAMKEFSGSSTIPWYERRTEIQSVVIESGVTTIGKLAFAMSEEMTEATIPDSVTSIGVAAFAGSQKLENITIPRNVTVIPNTAFYGCNALEKITFNGDVTSIGAKAFSNCFALNIVNLPDSLETIGENAFYQCTGFTEIIIPDSVTSIGSQAFMYCIDLKNVTIGKGVTEVGDEAFASCKSLEELTWLAEGEVAFGQHMFDQYLGNGAYDSFAGNITLILARGCADQVTDSVVWNGYTFKSIQILCFDDTLNHSIVYTDNGDGTHHIECDLCGYVRDEVHYFGGDSTCDDCGYVCTHTVFTDGTCHCGLTGGYCGAEEDGKNLTWTLVDGTLTIKGEGAMMDYDSTNTAPWYSVRNDIVSIVIENGVTAIGICAFSSCKYATTVEIPDSLTNIGEAAFARCSSLESITIPEKVTVISTQAFLQCRELKTVTINGNITSIEYGAFYDCHALTNIRFPNSLENIGSEAFFQCTKLTEVIIPNNVKSIGTQAFMYCASLKDVTIGKGVTQIGDSVFNGCEALENLTWLAEGEVTLGESVFTGTENIDLLLARGCADQVTDNVTWNGYTFKSIQILCTDGTLNHTYEYTDNGDGTHHLDCATCGYVTDEAHRYTDGLCVCGNAQMTITRQPASFEGLVGDMATFTVEAEGKGLTYQWFFSKDGGETWEKASSTKNTLSVEFKAYRLNYQYCCEITDADGDTLVSDVAVLGAREMDIVILTQPVSYVGAVNDEVTFTVEATGNGLVYEWFFSTDGGETWAKSYSPGYLTNTLSPILRSHRDDNMYKCVVTDVLGNSVESEAVSMTVEASDVIIVKQPVSVENAVLGQLYGFSVEAEGVNLTYRWEFSTDGGESWQESWNQGYNTATLSVRMNANRDGNLYRCVIISGQKVIVTSKAAVLDMQDPSVELIGQSDSIYITANETATFTVEAEGMDLTYLWYRSDDKGTTWYQTYLSGYNTNTLSFVGTVGRAAMYMCKITDGSGKVIWSEPVKLQVLSAELKILTQPVSTTCADGEKASFTVKAQGDSLKYQWYGSTDGVNWDKSYLGGYNTDTLSFDATPARAAKVYKCVITDAAGNTVETDVVSVNLA